MLSEHTDEILTELLGRTESQVAALRARGIVGSAPASSRAPDAP